jgi:effector-binding domain-containing protein
MRNDMPDFVPAVVDRPEQPYAYIRGSVRMDAFGVIADRLGELISWLRGRGVEFAGAPFFRFNTVDMAGESDVEAGVPVGALPEPEGDIQVGVLPAGRYSTIVHSGHPDQLFATAATLRAWTEDGGLTLDLEERDGVERWGCRLEAYQTDPRVEPDMEKWTIELSFLLTDPVE